MSSLAIVLFRWLRTFTVGCGMSIDNFLKYRIGIDNFDSYCGAVMRWKGEVWEGKKRYSTYLHTKIVEFRLEIIIDCMEIMVKWKHFRNLFVVRIPTM